MSAKPSRGWDSAAHGDLLLAFIEEATATKATITSVTEKLRKKGYTYSYDAVKYFILCLVYFTIMAIVNTH